MGLSEGSPIKAALALCDFHRAIVRLISVLPAFWILRVCDHRGAAVRKNVPERFKVALFAHRLILAVPLVLSVDVCHLLIHSLVNSGFEQSAQAYATQCGAHGENSGVTCYSHRLPAPAVHVLLRPAIQPCYALPFAWERGSRCSSGLVNTGVVGE